MFITTTLIEEEKKERLFESHSHSLIYRKDIDGLRAIAVLLVIFYHVGINFLPGGFIGVDIFFVISGFLITSRIIKEVKNEHFSLKNFYLDRMRRVLPVLIFVVFCVICVDFFLLMPDDFAHLTKNALYVLFFSSNFYFYNILALDYYHNDALSFPLLHTWSLGIEGQFYIVWPLLAWLCFKKRYARTVASETQRNRLILLTIFLMVAFFILSYQLSNKPLLLFYYPIVRACELCSGVMLALCQPHKISNKCAEILYIFGLLSILSAAFLKTDVWQAYIFLSCVGTIMLIYAGKNHNQWGYKLLSIKLLSNLGLLSYSLYLWHWPIIANIHYLGINLNAKSAMMCLVCALLLSILSWNYIEKPFRYEFKFNFPKSLGYFFILPSCVLCGILLVCLFAPNFGFNQISLYHLKTIKNYFGPYKNVCFEAPPLYPSSPEKCAIGELTKGNVDALIVGDSHASAAAGMLSVLLKDAHLKGYLVTQSSTPFIIGGFSNKENALKRNQLILNMINKSQYSYVVFAGFWNNYTNAFLHAGNHSDNEYTEFEKGLEKAIVAVIQHHGTPVLMMDIPPLLRVPITCGFSRIKLRHCYNDETIINQIQETTRNILMKLKSRHSDIVLIDPSKIICSQQKCFTSIKNQPLYSSGGYNSHLNYPGSLQIGKEYLNLTNPFQLHNSKQRKIHEENH